MFRFYSNRQYSNIDLRYRSVIAEHIKDLKKQGFEYIVVVNGYPKSGNSWLCRILAGYLKCDILGYLGNPDAEEISKQASTGNKKVGILKSHHVPAHLLDLDTDFLKVIHIVRDPRDVCISAAAYFNKGLYRFAPLRSFLLFKTGRDLVRNNASRPTWWATGWSGFYAPLLKAQYLVRYEDLLSHNFTHLTAFLEKISEFDQKTFDSAIEENSFSNMKKKGDKMGTTFLRSGKAGGYKRDLPSFVLAMINKACRKTMQSYDYQV